MDAIAGYTARDPDEAKGIADRVLPRLTHANSAVVLSAIKVIMKNMHFLQSQEEALFYCQKMTPPLGVFSFLQRFSCTIIIISRAVVIHQSLCC